MLKRLSEKQTLADYK